MTNEPLHYRLCLMLAFQSMIADGKNLEGPDVEKRVVELARRMDEFCALNFSKAFPTDEFNFVEDRRAARIDTEITLYKEELRTKEQTQLPKEREDLIQLYDRLQQRKVRRMQWQFYATAKEEKIADLVLKLLDEELEDRGAEAGQ